MAFKLRLPFGSSAKQQPEGPRGPSYHAVSVRAGKNACEAAQRFSGRRVLSAEALLLPLADCDRADRCTCSYQHHEDRRGHPRRRSDGAPPTDGAAEYSEQRRGQGRRSEDHPEYDNTESNDSDDSQLVADTYYGYMRKPGTD